MWYERRVDTMLSRLSRRGMASVSLRMTGAPITGPVLTEGVGYVEASDDKHLAVGDRVFATKLRGAWGGEDERVAADSARCFKVPGDAPTARVANLASAVTAYKLLSGVEAGSVVLHLGGEGPVGQLVAQIGATREVHVVSLVSPHVLDPEAAVDVIKNLGAAAAAPASFATTATFRSVVRGFGDVARVLVDVSGMDVIGANACLLGAAKSTSAGRKAVADAHPADVRDAKVIQTLKALAADGAYLHTYGGRDGDSHLLAVDARPFDFDKFASGSPEFQAVVDEVCGADLVVISEAHATHQLPRALHVANGAVHKHAYRAPLWLADE